ncbi:MAG: hypothetical protein HY600_06785 [Candidatus Omnitrophica bacterium]|nr:hypothetical protein [Candidatus Omnitrophota bacterium]
MRRGCRGLALGGVLLAAAVASPAGAEPLEITTYYPAPAPPPATPSKPSLVSVSIPDDEGAVYLDVYTALELWRLGVDRTAITIVRWRCTEWNGMSPNDWRTTTSAPMPSLRTKINFLQGGPNPVVRVWAPSMERGMIYTGKSPFGGSASAPPLILEVEVTWP